MNYEELKAELGPDFKKDGDVMVGRTQKWLNDTYGGKVGYGENITVSGYNALTRALQIEFGITATANNFGPTTIRRFKERFPNGIKQQADDDETESNIYGIIQGALWCKGYSTRSEQITKHFYGGTGRGIKDMKIDAGMYNPDSTVTIDAMEALLSMRQFQKVYGGDDNIREMQQFLNRVFPGYINYGPCDGIYGREMCKNLILALQAIEGLDTDTANGNFGPTTKRLVPVIPYTGSTYTAEDIVKAILLVRYSLYCNGYKDVDIQSGEWDNSLGETLKIFQSNMCLNETGICDLDTWMSLMTSRGNPERSCIACDTRFEMTDERLAYLKNNGYQIVGRYLTGGTFKVLRRGEVKKILDEELSLIMIYQESGANLEYFNYERGEIDARRAALAARRHGIQGDNTIYFAVDTDPVDSEITKYIIPYFKGISENIMPQYRVGIYGTRNVCTQVMNKGYAETCFVSDMSTGYSGNLGFKMPEYWTFDQFNEIQVSTESGSWDLDKDAYHKRLDEGDTVEKLYDKILGYNYYISELESLYADYRREQSKTCNALEAVRGVTQFFRSFKGYSDTEFYINFLGDIDREFIKYVKDKDYHLYDKLAEYANSQLLALIDEQGGLIDIAHLAATLEAYLFLTVLEPMWVGWAGDLASLMCDIDQKHEKDGTSYDELGKKLCGKRSSFNYADICTDADAIGIKNIINVLGNEYPSEHLLSHAIGMYYQNDYVKDRFKNYLQDIGVKDNEKVDKEAIEHRLAGVLNNFATNYLGHAPTRGAVNAANKAFADFINEYLDYADWLQWVE